MPPVDETITGENDAQPPECRLMLTQRQKGSHLSIGATGIKLQNAVVMMHAKVGRTEGPGEPPTLNMPVLYSKGGPQT